MWSLKYDTDVLIYKTKADTPMERTLLRLPSWRRSGAAMKGEFGVSRCRLAHIEWISYMVLLYSARSYIQKPVINHSEKDDKRECTHVYN